MSDVSPHMAYLLVSSAVAFLTIGSFAVPVKHPSIAALNMQPLEWQTYKTLMVVAVSPLSLVVPNYSPETQQLYYNSTPYFSPWGIISGLFWVPAGTSAICAVKNAGLGVGQGLWSVLVSVLLPLCLTFPSVSPRFIALFVHWSLFLFKTLTPPRFTDSASFFRVGHLDIL